MGWTVCWVQAMSKEFFDQIDALTEAGQLRRLSGAFARFIASVGEASPQLMAACVLLSELEGRGHSCLLLSELNADPAALLGWSGDEWSELRATVGSWPENVAGWRDLRGARPEAPLVEKMFSLLRREGSNRRFPVRRGQGRDPRGQRVGREARRVHRPPSGGHRWPP